MDIKKELALIDEAQGFINCAAQRVERLSCLPDRKKELIDRLQNIVNDLAADEIALKDAFKENS